MGRLATCQRICWALTADEIKRRRRMVRLVPNNAYEIALAQPDAGAGGYVQKSSVSRIRLGFVVLEVAGGGELTKAVKHRRLKLGDSQLVSTKTHRKLSESLERSLSGETPLAKWHNEDTGTNSDEFNSRWLSEPGISITALSMDTFEPVYHRCFRTYGYKDGFASSTAVAELMTELSELGSLSQIAGMANKHLWIMSSSGGWEVRSEVLKLGELLTDFLKALGMEDEDDLKAVVKASLLSNSESGRGCQTFAFVGITSNSSGTVAFTMPKWKGSQYKAARIKIALSFDEKQWFPAFKWTGEHWQVWSKTRHVEDESSGRQVRRTISNTSRDLKLKRNHIIIDELEDIVKYFSNPSANSTVPLDLTCFLQIILDMIDGYRHENPGVHMNYSTDDNDDGDDDDSAYGIHDASLPSPRAFTNALELFSLQLEAVLSRLMINYDVANQLVEAGVVEFLVRRIKNCHKIEDNEKVSSSVWLLCLLASEGINLQESPRAYGESCGTLLEYSKHSPPRILPEICRRGGVSAVVDAFEMTWKYAVDKLQYQLLHRMAVFMLQTAEVEPQMAGLKFRYKEEDGAEETLSMTALETRLPTKRKQLPLTEAKLTIAKIEPMENPYEPKQTQAWGPGWGSSGELLTISSECLENAGGSILMIPPASEWKDHCSIVLQACRLVWLASVAGASAVIFVWPGPLIQQIHTNLNFAQYSPIPSFVVPSSKKLERLIDQDGITGTCCSIVVECCQLQAIEKLDLLDYSSVSPTTRSITIQFCTCLTNLRNRIPKVIGPTDRPVRILCLDGGGVKGISTIFMLKAILQEVQKGHPDAEIDSLFDLIVGTSAGGLIAMGLGAGMTLKDIHEFYTHSVREIFASRDSYWEQLQRGPGASAARRFQEIIRAEWPKRTTSSSADLPFFSTPFHQCEAKLGKLPGVCLVSTLVSREPSRTCMVKNYFSDFNRLSSMPGEFRASTLQGSRATSAAPYYLEEMLCYKDLGTGEFAASPGSAKPPDAPFHMMPVMTTYRFVDGAIMVNNPTVAAILEARNIYPDHPVIVVSLGTGQGLTRCPIKTYPSGVGVVLQNLINSTADVSQSDSQARQILNTESTDSYYRFCPVADVFNCDIGSNDKKILDKIGEEASRYMESARVKAKVKEMIVELTKVDMS